MSRELRRLLHRTAVEPSTELDTARVVVRGRRRRRIRRACAAAGSAAVLLIAAGLVIGGPAGQPQPPEIAERPDRPQPSDPDPDEGDEGVEDGPSPRSDEEEVERIMAGEAGVDLLIADDRGVHRIDAEGEQRLWDTPAARALSDRAGGAVVQEADQDVIRRIAGDGPQPPIATDEQRPTLHAVVDDGERPTVLFTRRQGEGDAETETLHAYRLDDGTEEELGVTGRLESGISGATLVDGDLLLLRCHLECTLVRVPWGADPEGEQAVELHDQPLPLHGLDAYGSTAAYVHLPLDRPDTDEGSEPQLWLHDLADDEPDEISLPPPDDLEALTITVDVAADGPTAVIGFHPPERGTSQTLLIDQLDQQPRVRRLEATGHVRLATP